MERFQPFADLARAALLLRAQSGLSSLPDPRRLPNGTKDFEQCRPDEIAVKTEPPSEQSVWLLLRQGREAFDYNMALDEALLESAPELACPVLRFYGWTEPAGSFGYSQRWAEIERMTLLRPLVRRPTGGGLVPHDNDWTYSLIFPPEHSWYLLKAAESYRRVHEWLRDAFALIGVPATLSPHRQKEIPGQCFIGAEKDDLLWLGRKIAGAAQRRTRDGLLIQGSVQPPPISLSRDRWETAMCEVARERMAINWKMLEPASGLLDLVETLRAAKYGRKEFNQKR
jgi:lipoyl(octanoyl) transferase